MKWLELRDMESTPNCWDHTDDCNIEKGKVLYMSIYSIDMSSDILHSSLEIQSEYLNSWGFETIWCVQKILEIKTEL
jgi:hypothetical protein